MVKAVSLSVCNMLITISILTLLTLARELIGEISNVFLPQVILARNAAGG
jgi:hypothetical protein